MSFMVVGRRSACEKGGRSGKGGGSGERHGVKIGHLARAAVIIIMSDLIIYMVVSQL